MPQWPSLVGETRPCFLGLETPWGCRIGPRQEALRGGVDQRQRAQQGRQVAQHQGRRSQLASAMPPLRAGRARRVSTPTSVLSAQGRSAAPGRGT